MLLHVACIAINLKFPTAKLLPGHQYERGVTFNRHNIDTETNVHPSITSRFSRKGHKRMCIMRSNIFSHKICEIRYKIRPYVKSTIAVPGEKLIQRSEHRIHFTVARSGLVLTELCLHQHLCNIIYHVV